MSGKNETVEYFPFLYCRTHNTIIHKFYNDPHFPRVAVKSAR